MLHRDTQPQKESAPRKFESLPVPDSLLGKSLQEVRQALTTQLGESLATIDDLEYIKLNSSEFTHLRSPGVYHYAFGQVGERVGDPRVSSIHWHEYSRTFRRFGKWVPNDTSRTMHVLVRK